MYSWQYYWCYVSSWLSDPNNIFPFSYIMRAIISSEAKHNFVGEKFSVSLAKSPSYYKIRLKVVSFFCCCCCWSRGIIIEHIHICIIVYMCGLGDRIRVDVYLQRRVNILWSILYPQTPHIHYISWEMSDLILLGVWNVDMAYIYSETHQLILTYEHC